MLVVVQDDWFRPFEGTQRPQDLGANLGMLSHQIELPPV